MRNFRAVTLGFALAAALVSGGTMLAGDRHEDRRDIRRDEVGMSRLRADIARDRCRLDEHLRAGRRWEAARDREMLERDEHRLMERLRDVRHDRNDYYRDSFRGR